MAILTPDELVELRSVMARNSDTVAWTKNDINAALQAIEDRMRSAGTQNAINTDVEAAVPGVFNTQQKNKLFGAWCHSASRRLGMT